MPDPFQWVGFAATVAGTGLSLWAALSARGAKEQAKLAQLAAERSGAMVQLTDFVSELQELQSLLQLSNVPGIAAKSAVLRGRIVRYKEQSYHLMKADAVAHLDLIRDYLEIIGRLAAASRRRVENRPGDMQVSLSFCNEATQRVLGIQHRMLPGESR